MNAVPVRSTRLDLPDDAEAVYAYFEANGFGDGHPVIPPTVSHFTLEWQKFYTVAPDAMVPMVGSPDAIEIIVIGGAGPNSLYFPHGYGPFTRKIARHWRSTRI
jgi:hypothetical protein